MFGLDDSSTIGINVAIGVAVIFAVVFVLALLCGLLSYEVGLLDAAEEGASILATREMFL